MLKKGWEGIEIRKSIEMHQGNETKWPITKANGYKIIAIYQCESNLKENFQIEATMSMIRFFYFHFVFYFIYYCYYYCNSFILTFYFLIQTKSKSLFMVNISVASTNCITKPSFTETFSFQKPVRNSVVFFNFLMSKNVFSESIPYPQTFMIIMNWVLSQ